MALTLRREGYDEPITLIGGEPTWPYQRPPLTKAFLRGEAAPEGLALGRTDLYEKNRVALVLGERVVQVTLAGTSGVAVTDTGRRVHFSALGLAVGGRPLVPPIPGADDARAYKVRRIEDAVTLRAALQTPGRVVVVGAGFIGLEVAATARGLGHDVVVLEAAPRVMGRSLVPAVAERVRRAHTDAGTDVRCDCPVEEITWLGDGTAAVRTRRDQFDADVVVVATGMGPDLTIAGQLGLAVARGVLVDTSGRTSHPMVYAAGDCAQLLDPDGKPGLLLESVPNAVEQAKRAAHTMAASAPPMASVPWFWSDQGVLKLQIAGLASDTDEVVFGPGSTPDAWTALLFRAGRLVAVHALNQPREFLRLRRQLDAHQLLTPDDFIGVKDVREAVDRTQSAAKVLEERAK
jgi:3-phenylpropionate/trans-cinnamate dioxygenase ferredoxin reductase subunit